MKLFAECDGTKDSIISVLRKMVKQLNTEITLQDGTEETGSTLCMALIIQENGTVNSLSIRNNHRIDRRTLYSVNLGDSRSVLYRNEKPFRLTLDHKATCIWEAEQIFKKGHHIFRNRLEGNLAVTRALGDKSLIEVIYPSFSSSNILPFRPSSKNLK
jgi:serine/threonine protein phosphatase PrpC